MRSRQFHSGLSVFHVMKNIITKKGITVQLNEMSFLIIYQLCKNNKSHFKHRYSIGNSLFKSFPAVSIYLCFVFLTVSKTTRAAYTAAAASHTFDEILVEYTALFLHQCRAAFLDAVT